MVVVFIENMDSEGYNLRVIDPSSCNYYAITLPSFDTYHIYTYVKIKSIFERGVHNRPIPAIGWLRTCGYRALSLVRYTLLLTLHGVKQYSYFNYGLIALLNVAIGFIS